MTQGLTACPPPLSQRCRWPPQGWVSPTVILVDTQVWKLLAWIWTQCIEMMMEPGWKKSFIQLSILWANPQAVAFSVLWGRRSYFCVGQSTLYFPQSWEPMRFVSLLHEDTSDSPFLRLSWLLITEFHTRATNRSRSTNSTRTKTQWSSLVDSRKFSPPWKITQRLPPHSSLSFFLLQF